MKILKILLFLSFPLTSLSAFSMHHETSHNFSDCEGEVGNLYISKMLKNGSVEGFKQAVKKHQEFYQSRELDVRVIPGIQYERNDEGTVENLHSLTTMVIFPNRKTRENWGNRDFSENDQKEFDAFVNLYNENNQVEDRKSVCFLD